MITSAVNDITDPNNPNRLKDLRQIMISASDALLRANPGKYKFTTQEITENPDLHKFRAAHDALISASELQEVSRDDRRVIFEANNVSEGFSIKKYEVFQESRVL